MHVYVKYSTKASSEAKPVLRCTIQQGYTNVYRKYIIYTYIYKRSISSVDKKRDGLQGKRYDDRFSGRNNEVDMSIQDE